MDGFEPPAATDIRGLARALVDRTVAARERMRQDPFGNPALDMALAISRMIDDGALATADLAALIRTLRDDAYAGRARRLAAYVGGVDLSSSTGAMAAIAWRLASGDAATFRAETERTRFSAVFTAHPTFSMPAEVGRELALMASGAPPRPSRKSHRPQKPTLLDEFEQAVDAIQAGRDAIDRLTEHLLGAARVRFPDEWTGFVPKPVTLASWVGYDTDGRTDINWWDTIRLRLQMKAMQLERLASQVQGIAAARELHDRLKTALRTVEAQCAACPTGAAAEPEVVAAFAAILIERREEALVSVAPLLPMFEQAIVASDGDQQMRLVVARASLVSHGLSLAHSQFRLNASQLHNALRQLAGLDDAVGDAARRRAMLAGINGALDRLEPAGVDFGALLSESSSAVRLMMTLAQIVKHIDADSPVRFHIAETENGYTLLCALWLARLFGIDDRIEISPLFETAEALERGSRVLDEALRSRHFRDYLTRTGTLALEFGYSDSGRYVGQLAASYMIERQRLKIAETLTRHGVADVEVVFFDTHGESIGRGAHPDALLDRLKFLNPTRARKELARAGLTVREESAFQGGDGYLLFGSEALALASVARIAEHVFDEDARPEASRLPPDPVYADPDFAADFFGAICAAMEELVEDPGYAALLGAFGPALLDPTGSRPSARQVDGMGGPAVIRHPRELRAIPNNAILQQLGWCANTIQGLGSALSRHPQSFAELMAKSPRFRRAMDFAAHALKHSDLDVLRAIVASLDPSSWLNRAEHEADPKQREALIRVSAALERLGISSSAAAMLRKIQVDHLALKGVWSDAPSMAAEELLLHAIRLALVERIWLLAIEIPSFAPKSGLTHDMAVARILRLDVTEPLKMLEAIFPAKPDRAAELDYHEPKGFRTAGGYEREHRELFQPMAELFALVREVSAAVGHSVGAFG
ncbi:phosphoenolpyruvate carboxylase [Chelatococcus sambhunathii]|uniref:Phosphoenolpyruvate carboxylase n=1 Tax=Chelatococcus sambhunathii TaxID=363953 RepID=A0ABU1DC90_9HYPH|nr:phosphoenolpyruvate carboxylase [Chelatococcus sambhunathii]MDR4305726.1 phosphoenolpyruvate carboxylase [Chelatococcus sambhunathii]